MYHSKGKACSVSVCWSFTTRFEVLLQSPYVLKQRRKVILHNLPGQIQIDPEIVVDKLVPHPGNLSLRHRRIPGTEIRGNVLDRFTKYFEAAEDRIVHQGVGEKLLVCEATCILLDLHDTFRNIVDI